MRRDELCALGEEAADLARVVDLGVPFGAIWVVGLSDDAEGKVLAAVTAALALDHTRPVVELGAFYKTHALAARCHRMWPPRIVLQRGDDVRARVRELFRVLGSSEMLVALGGARTEVGIRVIVRDDGPCGLAASIDPKTGDPELITVWSAASASALPSHAAAGTPWSLDRKTMRIVREGPPRVGPSDLDADTVERAADFADRAQLALGRPVEIELAHSRGKLVVLGVRPITVTPSFTDAAYARVALLSADEGPIAPLAIDCLDLALRNKAIRGGEDSEPRVARFYARAYRRIEGPAARPTLPDSEPALARLGAQVRRIAGDLARPLAAISALEQQVAIRVAHFDREVLEGADAPALLGAIRDRQRTVVDALTLLESTRVATIAAVSALEASSGAVPRECVKALAAIRRTRERRRIDEKLARFARYLIDEIGEIPEAHRIPGVVRRRWDEVRRELEGVRPLGVDVRPVPFGASDQALRAALLESLRATADAEESARADALRRLLATARGRPLGGVREALARSIAIGLAQLADTKGRIGEALASALLRLRTGACAIGARLCENGILDEPEDALYLDHQEIEDALAGEPGAYASRVRLRREADARWRHYDPPRRLAAR